MSVNIWLTDEASEIVGYKRAIIGARSDTYSLVRAVTNTVLGPLVAPGNQITRTAGGSTLQWITDPLDGAVGITALAWTLHFFASESSLAANVDLRFRAYLFRNGVESTLLLDYSDPAELSVSIIDRALTTGVATATTLQDKDRLVFKVYIIDAPTTTLATGWIATFSYNGLYTQGEGDAYVVCPNDLATTYGVPSAAITQVRQSLKDTSPTNPFITTSEIIQSISEALKEYSRDRPRDVAEYLSGDGTTFDLPLPARWIRGFSMIKEIEYPADNQYRTMIDQNEYEVLERSLANQPVLTLRFITQIPDSGTNNVLVRYTTRHIFNDELNTVPPEDFDPVMKLAASHAATMAASKAASALDNALNADGVQYGEVKNRYLDIAKVLRKYYTDHVANNDEAGPAGKIVDWDIRSANKTDYIFHGRRVR